MKSITLLILSLFITFFASAQKSNIYFNTSHISAVKIENELHVSFRLKVNKKATKRNEYLTLIPTLRDSIHREELYPIYISGKKGELIRYRKQLNFPTEIKSNLSEKFKAKNNEEIQYFISVPYESWMTKSSLAMDIIYESCCKTVVYPSEPMIQTLNLNKHILPYYSFSEIDSAIQSEGVELKKWVFSSFPQIDFEQGQWNINPIYMENLISLNQIKKAIESIQSNHLNNIHCIEIIGLSSPEGNTKLNSELGEKRAIALKDYIQAEFPELKNNSFMLLNGHENWKGLEELILSSEMPQKKDILAMLKNIHPDDGLKDKLKSYQNGYAYMYMVHNYFPRLRNACSLSIFYTTSANPGIDDLEKIKNYLKAHQYNACLSVLEKYKTNRAFWNIIGICYMMTDNRDKAINYFQKAINAGSKEAVLNIEYIK